uniref:Uncharacterized protein n=1 Tax=Arundo donax TaxID=35708 RepID=A0A0A9H7Z1_ARUDO
MSWMIRSGQPDELSLIFTFVIATEPRALALFWGVNLACEPYDMYSCVVVELFCWIRVKLTVQLLLVF